jgi:regulatory protein
MEKISAIRTRKGRGKQVNVFVNGKLALSLEAEVAIKEGLQIGQQISASHIETLTRSNHIHRCLNAANHYLGYRPRSESEIRKRLQQRGFDNDSIEAVLVKLKEQGLVDDTVFAQFWKDNREFFSPRSQWLTRSELKRKGVASDIIEQVVNTIDDKDNAYRAAINKARSLPLSDYLSFRRHLGGYLKRRGFGYEVINHTIGRMWQEQEGEAIKERR